jgi:DNA topoisomerase-2
MSSVNAIQKKDHRQHILDLPDTYIGSTEAVCENQWIFDDASGKMVYRAVAFNPGFYKIFDELIVNARDAVVRSNTTEGATPIKHIGVEVVETDCGQMIIVENDGDGIPVEIHPEYKVMAPELIFGHLLTSTNYDKSEEKVVGGKNGYGAKLTNIYSKIFTVEVKNPGCGKHYEQTWSDNMTACSKPTVKKMTGSKGMVRVEFVPDYDRFSGVLGEDGLLSADMLGVLYTRVIELAAVVGNGVKVSWNKAVLPTNTFEKYVKLFCRDGASVFHEVAGPRWDIAVALTSHLADECDCNHVSFANGIRTRKGGKHVEAVQKNVIGDFCEAAKKKKVDIKPAQLRDNVIFFINATIVNPSFDSQTKDFLTTPASKFGSSPKFSGSLVTGLMRSGLLDEAKQILEAKLDKDAKKTDGKKRSVLRGMPKLEDATLAGTAKSVECTLILTEGDSAATSAISGLQIVGRERWGVFPLKGKLLNVKDISLAKVNANEELTAIKKILGLEHGKKYKDVKSLRYGRVMVMADQDHDGSHIKGLLMNFFHTEWPELLQLGFVCSLLTPILKATRGKTQHSFYSIPEF